MQRRRLLAAASLPLLLAAPAAAQELVHHAQGVEKRVSQTVTLADPWAEGAGDAFFEPEPRDVEIKVHGDETQAESIAVELMMHGPWGWFHYSYPELDIRREEPEGRGVRTLRVPLDLDGDGAREILLVERLVSTRIELDDRGDPVAGARPRYDSHGVKLRFLDRQDQALVETVLSADPEDPGFAAVLNSELGGPVNAALQLLAGDFLFSQERYADARYRYRVAREWAERSLSGRQIDELATDMTLLDPDPDHPEFTWITAVLRHGALPPYYRRRY